MWLLAVHRILRRFQIGRKVFARLMVNRTRIVYVINLIPLYCFPSKNSYLRHRVKWIEALRRVNADKSVWEPCQSDRVCSVQFVDGVPTEQNLYPTLQLGYEVTASTRRKIIYHAYTPKRKKQLKDQSSSATSAVASTTDLPDVFLADNQHEGYCLPPNKSPCMACIQSPCLVMLIILFERVLHFVI